MNNIPSSVYRLQLNEAFALKQALDLLPYLDTLGIEGVYCSPLFESASANGYDIVNPNQINPLIGTLEEFDRFCEELKRRDMKLLLDIVPNHMGIKGKNNYWWLDVLEKGPNSPYAVFFDIEWNSIKPELKNKILLPILGAPYGQVLVNREIKLKAENDRFWITYGDFQLPVAKECYSFIEEGGSFENSDTLHTLLEQQHYRLAYWAVAGQEINYRRFFNINELVALHIENKDVLNAHHNWVFKLVEEGRVQGLRIDHPDGLYDPVIYFERLQEHHPAFIVVEKILDGDEALPENWKVSGTVGYEYLNCLNGLFVQKNNESQISKIYDAFAGQKTDFDLLLYEKKKRFIYHNMGSESTTLGWKLDRLSELDRYYRDLTRIELTLALREIIACFPVYRTYIREGEEIDKRDRDYMIQAIEKAKTKTPEISPLFYDYIEKICLLELKEGGDFVMLLQQLTGQVMAKGLEDSAFYVFNRLLSLNEVGGNPKTFGVSKALFHHYNQEKREKWPLGLLTASTQDTKRSEDARMRLNVLSEIPEKWGESLFSWSQGKLLDANTEYAIYQMLLAVWPDDPNEAMTPGFFERVWTCVLKAIREAGVQTSWHMQNQEYEEKVKKFLISLFSSSNFASSFLPFQKEISHFGKLNSLSALILRSGGCGIVDLYQGDETWNYSLMDPDNRRAVDYTKPATKKFEITKKVLRFRRRYKELFLEGEYLPLGVQGPSSENVIAYLRKKDEAYALVVAGRFFTECPTWEGMTLLSPEAVKEWKDLFTEQTVHARKKGELLASEIFSQNAFAILTNLEVAC